MKNPYYWDSESVFLDQINVEWETSETDICKEFAEEKTHWMGLPFNWSGIGKTQEGLECVLNTNALFIYFNTEVFPFCLPLVRKAFECVVDRHEVVKTIFPRRAPLFTPYISTSSRGSFFGTTPKNKGKDLLEQGLRLYGCKQKDLPAIKINCCDIEEHVNLAMYLKREWEKNLGVCISIKIDAWNHFYQEVERGAFQVAGLFNHFFAKDPIPFLSDFAHPEANLSRWSSSEYCEVFDQLSQAPPKQREKKLRSVEAILFQYMPAFPVVRSAYLFRRSAQLSRVVIDQHGEIDFRFARFQNKQKQNQGCL